ncbi:MAG: hypothetical protein RI900_973 [Actinomycetota bacterium]
MYSASAPGDPDGVAVLVAAARTAAARHGASEGVAALAVELLAESARERHIIAEESSELSLEAAVDGTELVLSLSDRGEPIAGPSAKLLSLVGAGFLSAADGHVEGTGNVAVARLPLPSHSRLIDSTDLQVLGDDVVLTDRPVEFRELRPSDAAALTRCLYRCYGWTYPGTDLYYPDRVAAAIESGKRIGEVAVDESGEVAAHWGAVFVADGLVETGGTVTDPRFRRRGLANVVGDRLLERIVAMGVKGRMREPVLTHPATQHIALREGAKLVGVYVKSLQPLQQVGITDGVLDERVSLTVMYSPLVPLEPATLWVPGPYEAITREVLSVTDWPFELGEVRGLHEAPPASTVSVVYDATNRLGIVEVEVVGDDLVDAVDSALGQLRTAGADAVHVTLPIGEPTVARRGAGLGALGLAYACLLPNYGDAGHVLILQWVRDHRVDIGSWQFASEHVESVARAIVGQTEQLGDDMTTLRRREARRRQLFAALPSDD